MSRLIRAPRTPARPMRNTAHLRPVAAAHGRRRIHRHRCRSAAQNADAASEIAVHRLDRGNHLTAGVPSAQVGVMSSMVRRSACASARHLEHACTRVARRIAQAALPPWQPSSTSTVSPPRRMPILGIRSRILYGEGVRNAAVLRRAVPSIATCLPAAVGGRWPCRSR